MALQKVSLDQAYWFQEGPGVRKWQFTDHGIKLLNVANILKSGEIDLSKTDRYLSVEEVNERYSHFLVDEGDLVIASSGISIDSDGLLRTRGAFVESHHLPLCMNTSTIRFKAMDGISDLGFLKHWLNSLEFRLQITREVTGIAQKNFGPSHLKRLKISLPPLEEQKRIAAILDKADAIRKKRKKAIELNEQFLRSAFLDMFGDPITNPKGWPVVQLGEIGGSGQYGLNAAAIKDSAGIRFIRITDIDASGKIGRCDPAFVPSNIPKLEQYQLRRGDILIARTGATAGKSYIHLESIETSVFAGYLIRFIIDKAKALPIYVFSFLQTDGYWSQLNNKKQVVAQPNVNAKLMASIKLPLPPLELQNKFSEIVDSTRRRNDKLIDSEIKLDELFNSLSQRAFKSEL